MPLSIGFSHSVSQIPLSFPSHSPHSVSEIPPFPWVFSSHCSFSLAYHWSFSLGYLSSPALSRFSLTIPLFSEEAGHHHRFKGQDTITIPLFSLSLSLGSLSPITDLLLIPSSHPSLTRQFPLLFASLSLCWIRWRGNRVRAGWVLFGDFYFSKEAAECARNNVFFMAWLWWNWLGFSVSIFDCDEEMKKKTGYRKKIDRQKIN